MKHCLTFILSLLLCSGARAQYIVYSENFDAMPSYTIVGWTNVFSGVVPWQSGLPYQVGGCMPPAGGPMSVNRGTNKVACIAECGTMFDYNDSNVLTSTPSINLSAISGAWLRFDSYFGEFVLGTHTERATVEVSTDNGATWSILRHIHASIPYGSFQSLYIDLAAYSHMSNVRIGFRYRDDGGWMKGWAIDNVEVIVPARKDVSLLSATPTDTMRSYVATGRGTTHTVKVFNAGLDTLTDYTLYYRQAGGPLRSHIVTGGHLPPFTAVQVGFPIEDTVWTEGLHLVALWAVADSDVWHYNDSAFTALRGAGFIPPKRMVLESGEGTYHGWTVRNRVLMNSVPDYDIPACLITIHEADPMVDTPYHDFMFDFGWNYVPYIMLDRRVSIPLDSFQSYVAAQQYYFGFADINASGFVDGHTLHINASAHAAVDIPGGCNMAVVVTEDNVTGHGAAWAQANNYAGGTHGVMGGFESLPNPVPADEIDYDHVARMIYPEPWGELLAASVTTGNTYIKEMSIELDPAWHMAGLKAMVLLIRNSDSAILNSYELPFNLIALQQQPATLPAGLYPNPSHEKATLYFDLPQDERADITITDMAGRQVSATISQQCHTGRNEVLLSVSTLPTGVYIVSITAATGTGNLKMQVIK